MKIALVMPPSEFLENDLAYPPMGLLYIATPLLQAGHEVQIVELGGGIDWRRKAKNIDADLVGIQCVTPTRPAVEEIARIVRENHPSVPIIVGGIHATFLPEDCLRMPIDAVVLNEADHIIRQVVEEVENGALKQRIYDGGMVPVAQIPKPCRQLVNLGRYSPGGEKTTPIYTSRGCPFRCAFCTSSKSYRELPLDRVAEEVDEVVNTYGFKHILLGDDDVGINQKRVIAISNLLKPFNIGFRLNQDARVMKEEACKAAAEAGCTEISWGAESGSQRMLDAMLKDIKVEQNTEAVRMTQRYGMQAKAYLIVNFPGETEETVSETLKWAGEARPDKWLLSAFAPLPGSPTWDHPERWGITWLSRDWGDYYLVGRNGGFKPCFKAPGLDFDRQVYLHDLMLDGLKSILGKENQVIPDQGVCL